MSSSRRPGKRSGSSCLRTVLELSLFGIWLAVTGLAGYLIGSSTELPCIPQPSLDTASDGVDIKMNQEADAACVESSDEAGLTYEQIRAVWACKSEGNTSHFNQRMYPTDGSLGSTKWESILSVDPSKFFAMYLSQYPGDTRAVQPVVIFSHKPLDRLEDAPEVCKVLDIAVVPDSPGVCVAVTETYHDVASYHMLHADKKPDGSFSLTSNYLAGRDLPSDAHYAQAREMLAEYFTHAEYVAAQVTNARIQGPRICCLVESDDEVSLFANSVMSIVNAGTQIKAIVAFSSSTSVLKKLLQLGVQTVDLSRLSGVGKAVSPAMRRHFLQAWLAFAVANANARVVWQSPATVWLTSLTTLLASELNVELLWAFKGRRDRRAAPFFVSFDFFIPNGSERPVHLMHELMLHFDLVLAWNSLDAVGAYRLAENNARYGTTTKIFPPTSVLHIELLDSNPDKIIAALGSTQRPGVVVFPQEGRTAAELKLLLQTTRLWKV